MSRRRYGGQQGMTESAPAADRNEMARRVIDGNHYLVLGTVDPDGSPRLSPVFYTPARYTDLYWISSPTTHHSRNIADRPAVEIVIFDSSVPVGDGECVYLAATATQVDDDEVDEVIGEAFRPRAGAQAIPADELRGAARRRLYRARIERCEVHVSIPGLGDRREPADPTG